MKKRTIIIIAVILPIILGSIIVYDINSTSYTITSDDSNTFVNIDGNKYYFCQYYEWFPSSTNKRIGYIDNEPSFGRIFFHSLPLLPVGLYTIKDDEQNLFHQIHTFYDSSYNMLVREDIDLSPPEIEDVTQIEFNNKTINDSDTIADFMELYHNVDDYVTEYPATFPASIHYLEVYSKLYSGIYYRVEVYQSENSSDYYIHRYSYDTKLGYIKIPNELIDKLLH